MGLFDPSDPEGADGLPLDLSSFTQGQPAEKKTNWKQLAPLLALLPIAFAKHGRAGGAGLLRGFQEGIDRTRTQSRQDALDQQAQAYRQAQLQSLDETRRANAANQQTTRRQQFLDKFSAGLDALDSPEAVDAYLRLQGAQGQLLGVNPTELQALAPTPTALERRKATKALEALQKQRPDDWMNWSATIDGKPVKATDLLGITRSPDAPEPTPKAETRSLDVQAADALARGDTATYNRLLKVKKEMGQADDRPPDPSIAAMRGLQMELARQRLNTAATQLPAGTVRRVDAKAKAFDTQPAVKNTQLMAEAGAFADSLNVNTQNPADDIGLIYAFAKAMDPNSVVREGEYATVQKYAQTWADSFRFNAQRIFSNTAFLTPEARMNMKKVIRSKFLAGKGQYDALRKSYADQINKITGAQDGDTYLTDYAAGFPKEATPPTSSTGAAPTGGVSYQDYLRSRGGK